MAVLPNRLAMILLVRNEIDVIELNIRFHAAMGINKFLVMDNGSTDGTLEVLKNLQSDVELEIVENPKGLYQQSKWMTELARLAKSRFGVSHVIPNDADEFWVPRDFQSLPDFVDASAAVQSVHRYNRLLTAEQVERQYPFFASEYVVESPILYSGEIQKSNDNVSMQLVKISPKVIVQPRGLIKIKGGNHRADHMKRWSKTKNADIEVHHFPIRSYKQFHANIENRQHLLDKPNVKMGPHYRRWVKQILDGRLEEEFARLTPPVGQLEILQQVGVVQMEPRLAEALKATARSCVYSAGQYVVKA